MTTRNRKTTAMTRAIFCVGLGLLLAACSSEDVDAQRDQGVDQGVDATADRGVDQAADQADHADQGVDQAVAADDDVIARASVVLNSCLSDDGFLRTPTYLRGTRGGYQYPDFDLECVAATTDGCTGALACLGIVIVETPPPCGTCEGNTANVCADGFDATWDCSKVNGTCVEGYCLSAGRQMCSGLESYCDDEGRPTFCDDMLHHGPRCADLGLQCTEEGLSRPRCDGTGDPCEGKQDSYFAVDYVGTSCNGDTLTGCIGGGSGTLDCSKLGEGFSCQQLGDVFFCGVAAECNPETYAKRCEGSEVVFCEAGKLRRVDCATLGFDGCADHVKLGCSDSPS